MKLLYMYMISMYTAAIYVHYIAKFIIIYIIVF